MTNLQNNLEALNEDYARMQRKIQVVLDDPALKIKEHKKAELDQEINGMSKKMFALQDHLRKNQSQQEEIDARISRLPPPPPHRTASVPRVRRGAQSESGEQLAA